MTRSCAEQEDAAIMEVKLSGSVVSPHPRLLIDSESIDSGREEYFVLREVSRETSIEEDCIDSTGDRQLMYAAAALRLASIFGQSLLALGSKFSGQPTASRLHGWTFAK